MSLENIAEYTVSELSTALKRTLEDAYGHVRVRGEISGFKRAASGHLYFALKDESAVLDAVCWRGTAQRLGCAPEDGLEVVASGRISTYPGRSKYQLIVDQLAPAGIGALMALLEARKKKLAEEGLFAAERKQPLPFLPEIIGLVTSPTGAVISDILHRLEERFPRHVLVWPVLVQGELAAPQIAAAIDGFNRLEPHGAVPRPDLLIVARGGGSLEDLWAFNEESVVRAAAASTIPLISAVGHETDTTLIDFAADQRAPTPTAAAELAVPVRAELAQRIGQLDGRLFQAMTRSLRELSQLVSGLGRGLPDPIGLLGPANQRLDDLIERLPHGVTARIERLRLGLAELAARLGAPERIWRDAAARLQPPGEQLDYLFRALCRERGGEMMRLGQRLSLAEIRHRLARHISVLADLADRQDHAIGRRLAAAGDRLGAQASLLASLSHEGVLARGFALVRDERQRLVASAAEARGQSVLELEFHDGRVDATVGRGGHRTGRAKRRAGSDEQGRLL